MNRLELRTYIRDLGDEPDEYPEGLFTNVKLNALINLSQQRVALKLARFIPWAFQKKFNFSTVINKKTYSIGTDLAVTDFFMMNGIYRNVAGRKAKELVFLEKDQIGSLWHVDEGGEALAWTYDDAGNIMLSHLPAESVAGKYVGYYIPIFPDLNHDTVHYPLAGAGTNLVANGGFDATVTGWDGAYCVLTSIRGGQSGNCLCITNSLAPPNAWQSAYQTISGLTIGLNYLISFYVKSGTTGNEIGKVHFYMGSGSDPEVNFTTNDVWTKYELSFVATAASGVLSLVKNTSTWGTMLFDTVEFANSGLYAIPWMDIKSLYPAHPLIALDVLKKWHIADEEEGLDIREEFNDLLSEIVSTMTQAQGTTSRHRRSIDHNIIGGR